jgi:hypothetical protein
MLMPNPFFQHPETTLEATERRKKEDALRQEKKHRVSCQKAKSKRRK